MQNGMNGGGMPPQPQQPTMNGMAPTPQAPTAAQAKQAVEENANIAIQGGMAAAEAAKADPSVPDSAVAKIEEGTMLIAEGKQEAVAPVVTPQGGDGGGGNPVEGTGAQAEGTKES